MSESTKKIYYRRGGVTYEIKTYTSTSDVGSEYIGLNIGGTTYYAKIGAVGDSNASYLRVQKGGATKAILSTAMQAKFGTGCLLVNDHTKYVTVSTDSSLDASGGIWCLEAWVYLTGNNGGNGFSIISDWVNDYPTRWIFDIYEGAIRMHTNSNAISFIAFRTVPFNTWHHVAISSDGTTARIFFNGELQNSRASFGLPYNGQVYLAKQIVNTVTDSNRYYLDDVRYTVGTARYTATFTPPTAPLDGSDAQTKFLLHMDGSGTTLIDSSTYGRAITSTLPQI